MYKIEMIDDVKEKNRKFIDEILQTTYAFRKQIEMRLEKELISKRKEIEESLRNIFGQVTYNWKMKVRNNALRGKHYTNLFFFNKTEESELFFIKNDLYRKINLDPPYLRLEKYFNDFGFEFKLIKKNGILVAYLSWEKYFDSELFINDEEEN